MTTLLGRGSEEPSPTSKSEPWGHYKSVNEHRVRTEALTQAKQREAGKENAKGQTPGTRTWIQRQGKFAGAAGKGKGKRT